jgi:hypothetical protein
MRKVQPVSFSLVDPFEKALYDHAVSKGVFSKYVKRLIQRDKEGIQQATIFPAIEKSEKPKGNTASFF